MFFVIPEMPSKTFVMVLKKLPDHFNSPQCPYFDPTFISHFCLYWVLPVRDPGTKIRVLRENIVRNTNFPGGESSGLWREGRGVGQVSSLLLLGGLERRDGAPDLAPL